MMHGLTDYITTQPWVDIFTTWYVLVDEAYQAIVTHVGRLRQRGPTPTLSDSEVLTIALIADTFFHGHEELCLSFVRQYHRDLFPYLVDDTRFNRRRRALVGVTEAGACIRPGSSRPMTRYGLWIAPPSRSVPICGVVRVRRWRGLSIVV